MNTINCDRKTFNKMLEEARILPTFDPKTGKASYARGTREELEKLSNPAKGLFPESYFRYSEFGRRISPKTWLHIARADKRGHHAMTRISLEEQHAIIERMIAECPAFFAGIYVEEPDAERATQSLGV